MKLIFEKSIKGKKNKHIPETGIEAGLHLEGSLLRDKAPGLPEVTELDLVRHYTNLSKENFSVDSNFYPLGSCTMKYNYKFMEDIAAIELFTGMHPYLPYLNTGEDYSQGALEILYNLQESLKIITGMDSVSLQPLAGAHGELTGMLMIREYHRKKNNDKKYVIVPDESHGTNPASVKMAGYDVLTVPTSSDGEMDIREFKRSLTDSVAAVILTCPNTLGIFNKKIKEVVDLAHTADALMYYDGANLNAILGKVKPGDIGFDILHVNLHKTFGTPHGGGGPGSGPVGVKEFLKRFLPVPNIIKDDKENYNLDFNISDTIGQISPFYGNFAVLLKAYAYILYLGKNGLNEVSDKAVLNANYIMESLKPYYELPYDRRCMHECVFSASKQVESGVHALDIAKHLIDRGVHPPTIYFPLIVKESIMIEPTESESKATLDNFIEIMIETSKLAKTDPDKLRSAPVTRGIKRLDEVNAARNLNLNYFKEK